MKMTTIATRTSTTTTAIHLEPRSITFVLHQLIGTSNYVFIELGRCPFSLKVIVAKAVLFDSAVVH